MFVADLFAGEARNIRVVEGVYAYDCFTGDDHSVIYFTAPAIRAICEICGSDNCRFRVHPFLPERPRGFPRNLFPEAADSGHLRGHSSTSLRPQPHEPDEVEELPVHRSHRSILRNFQPVILTCTARLGPGGGTPGDPVEGRRNLLDHPLAIIRRVEQEHEVQVPMPGLPQQSQILRQRPRHGGDRQLIHVLQRIIEEQDLVRIVRQIGSP